MADVKITKKVVLEAIKAVANTVDWAETAVTAEDVIAYCDTTLEQAAKKAVKAAERAAEKKAEADELREVVASLLTDEFQTRDAIFAQITDESGELTVHKVGARLTALINEGRAVKGDIKIEGVKGTHVGYKLA